MCRQVLRSVVEALEKRSPRLSGEERSWREQVATAALMVECGRADRNFSDDERRRIALGVRELFVLDEEVAEMLLAVAERRVDQVWHPWLFTQAIKRGFDSDERAELFRRLWEVARANGFLHEREAAFVEWIGRELEIPEAVLEECRRRAD